MRTKPFCTEGRITAYKTSPKKDVSFLLAILFCGLTIGMLFSKLAQNALATSNPKPFQHKTISQPKAVKTGLASI